MKTPEDHMVVSQPQPRGFSNFSSPNFFRSVVWSTWRIPWKRAATIWAPWKSDREVRLLRNRWTTYDYAFDMFLFPRELQAFWGFWCSILYFSGSVWLWIGVSYCPCWCCCWISILCGRAGARCRCWSVSLCGEWCHARDDIMSGQG